MAGGWDAIDNYTTLDCVVSPMGHLEGVPQALRADWARANVSVFEEIERAQEAQDEVALEAGAQVVQSVSAVRSARGGATAETSGDGHIHSEHQSTT